MPGVFTQRTLIGKECCIHCSYVKHKIRNDFHFTEAKLLDHEPQVKRTGLEDVEETPCWM